MLLTMAQCNKPVRMKLPIVEEPGFKNVKNKHLGISPF